jgi:hypothetical protein
VRVLVLAAGLYAATAAMAAPIEGGVIVLIDGPLELRLDAATLAITARLGDQPIGVTAPAFAARSFRHDAAKRTITYPDGVRVSYDVAGGGLTLGFDAPGALTLAFPHSLVPPTGVLILPEGEGSYIPADDTVWVKHLTSFDRDTLEGLSMPFWGIQSGESGSGVTTTYILDDPFYNTLRFTSSEAGLGVSLDHAFPANPAWRASFRVTICFDRGDDPLVSARRFRARLEEMRFIRTLAQKAVDVPRTLKLIGAVHAYVWSSGPLTMWDAPPAVWITLAKRIVTESKGGAASAGGHIRALLGAADWKVIADAAVEQYSYAYLRQELARVLSIVQDKDPKLLAASYGDILNPAAGWGGGVSTSLVDQIAAAGITRVLLTADGWEQVEKRPQVASYAEKAGFLFGSYDSFDSIHDPRYAETDQSWPTAQFGADLFKAGRILKADGTTRGGFKQVGFKLSPIAARPFVEARVKRNFGRVPYSYYFVDADAFGDWYDDYTPGREASARDDARARADRISWIARTFKVPVGSEGGAYLMTPFLTVAEGIFMPVIGWGDADMTTKGSAYYLGGYWPPDGPDVFFKPVPLKETYLHLHVDPRFRLPLYEAVFHDSVITSAHWSAADLKFINARQTVALTQALYQVAPLFHLNPGALAENRERIAASAAMFAATHSYSWKYPLQSFRFLSDDRLVQESVFGELHLLANFRAASYSWNGARVPAYSVMARNGSETRIYTP